MCLCEEVLESGVNVKECSVRLHKLDPNPQSIFILPKKNKREAWAVDGNVEGRGDSGV
jgi:hypothetical protein